METNTDLLELNGTIDLLNVNGEKEEKPIPKKDRINMKLNCDQNETKEEKDSINIEAKSKKGSIKKHN